jgi:hypothetical protein
MTTTLLPGDVLVVQPSRQPTVRRSGAPGRRPTASGPSVLPPGGQPTIGGPGGSGFTADTWLFFAAPRGDWSVSDRWALGFGPTEVARPRWSLFHCVADGRFDVRSVFPEVTPSNDALLGWGSSVVGLDTAAALLDSVGSFPDFYRQYFDERPDLRRGPGRPG